MNEKNVETVAATVASSTVAPSSAPVVSTLAEREAEKNKKLGVFEDAVELLKNVINGDNAKASKEAEADAKKAEMEYNQAYLAWLYENLAGNENPMLAAVRHGPVAAKKLKVKYDAKTNLMSVSIDDSYADGKNTLDLISFEAASDKRVAFRNGQWISAAADFARVMAAGVIADFKLSADEQKAMTASYSEAKETGAISLLSPKAPTTGNMVKDLQQLVDAILYLEIKNKKDESINKIKVTTRDIRYLQNIAATRGGFLNTKVVGPNIMRHDIMNILHGLVVELDKREAGGTPDAPYTFSFKSKAK